MPNDPDRPYRVRLTDSTHRAPIQSRTLWRGSDASAIDGAKRWLRLKNRVAAGVFTWDRWEVDAIVHGTHRYVRVDRGTIEDCR
jgi:hypothetical protein